MDVWQQEYNFNSGSWRLACGVAALAALAVPSTHVFGIAIVVRNGSRLAKMPFIWDSDWWSLFCDAAILIGIVKTSKQQLPGNEVIVVASPITQTLLGVFYFAAGAWKINTSFLNPRTSCGSIFMAQLLARAWPQAWTAPPDLLVQFVVRAGPWMTIIGECLSGLLLVPPWRCSRLSGLGLLLLLHVGISFTPYPNGIANFSYTAAIRYFFLLPEASAQALTEVVSLPRRPAGWVVRTGAVVAIAAAWNVGKAAGPQHMGAVFFSTLALLYTRAAQLELARLPETQATHLGAWGWLLVTTAVFAAFGGQILGLTDLGAPASPFASIRVHGGSNHWLLPTGILQAWAISYSASDSSLGGGVVRVEYTDSVYFNSLYPGEMTSELPPDAVSILRRGGHLARQFNPTCRRVIGALTIPWPHLKPEDGPFLRYTIPAVELRRLTSEARAIGQPFTLIYVRLPGAIGDEGWRADTSGPRIEFIVYGNGTERCTADGLSCGKDELVNLPELEFWQRRTQVFFPHPLISDADNELPCID